MSVQPWKRRGTDLVLSASPWVEVYREQVELPSGRVIDDFYRVVLPDFAAVVAVTAQQRLVMVCGYKHGIGRVVQSVPAGLVDQGESPLDAARRELLEETGYSAPTWHSLGSFIVDGNRQCGTMHVFVAQDALWTQPVRQDEAEELQVELVPPASVVAALRNGDIPHLATAAAIGLAVTFKFIAA
jgi:ADP-ribose pyrophosphatase